MRTIRSIQWIVAGVLTLSVAITVVARAADNDNAWVEQTTQACAACHGKHGVSNVAAFPTIAGQPTSYLIEALSDYRDGDRQNAVMAGQARGLTDAQIRALAAYYHRQSSPLSVPRPDDTHHGGSSSHD